MRRAILLTTAAALLAAGTFAAPIGGSGALAAGTPTVSFATPHDGDTVAGPAVEIGLDVTNFTLQPAGTTTQDGKGHAHILIDETPPGPRAFMPTNDPGIVHMGTPPLDGRAIELTAGKHTLYAVLGDSDHLVVNQQPAKITIVVAPGFRAQGPLAQACAEVARGTGDVRLVFPVAGGAVQGTISSKCAFSTNSGACVWTDESFRRAIGTFNPAQAAIAGTASGQNTRHLEKGSRGKCGPDRTTALAQENFQAAASGTTVRGVFGRSEFSLTADPSTRLAHPTAVAATQSSGGGSKKRSPLVYLPFVGAALLLAGAVAYVLQTRGADAEVPPAA